MTKNPDKTGHAEPAERPQTAKTPRRDAAAWYPHILQYRAGTPAGVIAERVGGKRHTVYRAEARLRALPDAKMAEVREEALRRRRLEAEAEYLVGDPAVATKIANAYVALRRAEHEERTAMMETRNTARPGENKEAKLSDAEVELLRADLRRRYIPELPARAEGCDAGSGDGKPAGRTRP
ncbi:hypothetical protein [Maricaulis salignorans]|uniref:Uncharacterized protein n=1 Tax=Maricaulis salignorans TaxID=144026 RepID=A0A1G9Q380_9PROT|nr:hypothetical protein [Maricaulis salignorans]SDM05502.1 hypothetical protein SAMN04488568_104146 [Maricaulis salignorans]